MLGDRSDHGYTPMNTDDKSWHASPARDCGKSDRPNDTSFRNPDDGFKAKESVSIRVHLWFSYSL